MDPSTRAALDRLNAGTDLRGVEPAVADWYDMFDRLPGHRIVMAAARRAGVPFSVAWEMWDTDDKAAEAGWDAWLANQDRHRCGGCGTDKRAMLDMDEEAGHRRPFKFPPHRASVEWCPLCAEIARTEGFLREQMKDSDGQGIPGYSVGIVPNDDEPAFELGI